MADQDVRDELVALERRGWDSLCDGTGDTFYGGLMIEDGLMVLVNGEIMDRHTVVQALGQAPPWRSYELSDIRLINVNADSAALVYVASAYRETQQPPFVALMSSVYVRRDGHWQLALYQQTQRPALST